MRPLKFPEHIEHYPIDYDPNTHAVDFPRIPGDVMSAVCIIDRILRDVIDCGVLAPEELELVCLNAIGKLKPEILKEDES